MSNIVPNTNARPDVLEHVSANVKRLRRAAGLSQEALAQAASVSRRMLVAIEGGEVNVSLTTLDRIAEALGVLFPDLVQAPSQAGASHIDALAWVGRDPSSRATLLASTAARRQVELWEWSLAPGETYTSEPDASGWHEMVYVVEGRLRLTLGALTRDIDAGDHWVFPSDQYYTYLNPGDRLLRFVRNVVS